jgi:hypothetical protein|tara:strand:+ start:571 stop:744 length:174 start_codon:yes stop_codon:yes gene_type:complete
MDMITLYQVIADLQQVQKYQGQPKFDMVEELIEKYEVAATKDQSRRAIAMLNGDSSC